MSPIAAISPATAIALEPFAHTQSSATFDSAGSVTSSAASSSLSSSSSSSSSNTEWADVKGLGPAPTASLASAEVKGSSGFGGGGEVSAAELEAVRAIDFEADIASVEQMLVTARNIRAAKDAAAAQALADKQNKAKALAQAQAQAQAQPKPAPPTGLILSRHMQPALCRP